ncbi:hypothetical protein [Paenibacillus odorifer]|nr:hypothetical protein [Paenibacillus odorifer]
MKSADEEDDGRAHKKTVPYLHTDTFLRVANLDSRYLASLTGLN